MCNLALTIRVAVLAALLLVGVAHSSTAQTQFGTAVQSSTNVTNEAAAVDANLTTAAILAPPLLGGSADIRLSFATVVLPGQRAGLYLNVGGAIGTSLFNSITINTYGGPGTLPAETFLLNSLVSLPALTNGPAFVPFPVGVPFSEVELVVTGAVNVLFTISLFEGFSNVNPLPVELTAFKGQAMASGVALTWQTASEHNNDHFVVERSVGSAEDFHAIGQVQGAGNSFQQQQYQWIDAAPERLNYYRLRQVDFDGKAAFSPVVAVKAQNIVLNLAAYPNPATETLTITGATGPIGLFDHLGRQLQVASIPLSAGQQLDVRSLPNGVYYLRDATAGTNTKFVKAAETGYR